ncbi:MAG: VacJ family lipoprotein [Pseudomonadota bacterium]
MKYHCYNFFKKIIKNSLKICPILAVFITGCCHIKHTNPDPLEKPNRAFFYVNNKIDYVALKPAATIYSTILPKPVRASVTNFFNNFLMPNTIGNDILQGDFYFALQDTWRFAINSTLGIGGLFDVGKHIGLPPHNTDFGITMMKWGWRHSTYIVVPFWGPTTIRDGLGSFADYYAFSPYFWLLRTTALRTGFWAVQGVNIRANLLQYNKLYKQVAFDPYIFTRNIFLQRRQMMLKQSIANTGFKPPQPFSKKSEAEQIRIMRHTQWYY